MRAKFGSILDASVTDENCEFRFVRLVSYGSRNFCPERKPSRVSTPRSWQTTPLRLSAAAQLTPEAVRVAHDLLPELARELPRCLALAASAPAFDRTDIDDYTVKLLRWWRDNCPAIPTWAKAARMAFTLTLA